MRSAVFLDRDGVINENREDYVKRWEEFAFLPGVMEALRKLARTDFAIIVITNQSAIGCGFVSKEEVEAINRRMVKEIEARGGRIDAVLFCPHRPDDGCACRKPLPGLLLQAAEGLHLSLGSSYLVGDALSDLEAGMRVGCQSILVLTGRGRENLPLLAEGYEGCIVVSDLMEAVDWILLQVDN